MPGPARWSLACAMFVLSSMCVVGCGRAGYDAMDAAVDSSFDIGLEETGVDAAPDAVVDSAADVRMDAVDASPDGSMDSGKDAALPCAAECRYDVSMAGAAPACTGPASVTASPITMSQMTAIIDMTGFTSLTLTVDACDVTGFSFHVGDSNSNDGFGGDGGTSSNDAEVQITNGALGVYANDSVTPALQGTIVDVLPTTGCGSYAIELADQRVTTPTMDFTGPHLLRIDPPTDAEGTPDALWHLGLNRSYANSTRTGTGTTVTTLCFR